MVLPRGPRENPRGHLCGRRKKEAGLENLQQSEEVFLEGQAGTAGAYLSGLARVRAQAPTLATTFVHRRGWNGWNGRDDSRMSLLLLYHSSAQDLYHSSISYFPNSRQKISKHLVNERSLCDRNMPSQLIPSYVSLENCELRHMYGSRLFHLFLMLWATGDNTHPHSIPSLPRIICKYDSSARQFYRAARYLGYQ